MDKSLPLLASHLRISITEDEPDGCEEVAFPGAIATDYYIQFWREWVDDCLVLVAVEEVRAVCGGDENDFTF